MMMQFSVYSKIFNNRDAAKNHVEILKKHVPSVGQIRIMIVQRQYRKMEIIVGGISRQESIVNEQAMLVL